MNSFFTTPELISQGTYGCIFKPGMNCKGEIEKEGFITKLQNDQETTQNEYAIGKILLETDITMDHKKKKEYSERFAPILNSCPIQLGKIKENFIEKCNIMKNNPLQTPFYSNQLRYVGKHTLYNFFDILKQEPNTLKIIYFCGVFHTYLLDSILLLKEKKIVHFDLKENNILIDQKRHIPVIIDFGLSINMDLLLGKKEMDPYLYTKTFFTYYDKYPPWCLEIVLISFIVNNTEVSSIWGGARKESSLDWSSKLVKKDDLFSIIDHYFKYNHVVKWISLEKKEESKKQWMDWIQHLYTEKKSSVSGKFMVNKLIPFWYSWDCFSISVLFFLLLRKFLPNHFLEYHQLLTENILAIPTKRETPDVFKKKLSNYFHSNTILQEMKSLRSI